MYGIARGVDARTSEDNFFRSLKMCTLHCKHLIRQSQQGVECGLNRVAAIDGSIAMERFPAVLLVSEPGAHARSRVFRATVVHRFDGGEGAAERHI